MTWTRADAIDLCIQIETICPMYGCHVALTGGCLYRAGERKDLDLVFYRIRQSPEIDTHGLFLALEVIGIERLPSKTLDAWCIKATHRGRKIDCFFPERETGGYE